MVYDASDDIMAIECADDDALDRSQLAHDSTIRIKSGDAALNYHHRVSTTSFSNHNHLTNHL